MTSCSRREFVAAAGAAAGLAMLAGCGRDAALPAPAVTSYFDLLREMRRRVRTSPDSVDAMLESMATNGDIAGLVEYLRRHFAVLPGNPQSWVSPLSAVRWGPRGAARSRSGTPREIAELLADTLRVQGIEASVIVSPERGSARPLLANAEPLPFQPATSPDDLAAATAAMPAPDVAPADPGVAERIADRALEALAAEGFRPSVTAELSAALPDVLIGDQVAGLWSRSPGPHPAGANLLGTQTIGRAPEARLTLSISTTREPGRLVEVADASFRLDDLAGRRVDVGFIPPAASPLELLALRPADVLSVIPTIRVAGINMNDEERGRLQVAGTALTVEGDLLDETDQGFGVRDGSLNAGGDPARVAALRIGRIVASRYPRLDVEFDALDANGDPITNIAAEHFKIEEQGITAPHLLRHNEASPPAIVFLVDKSTSMPAQYRDSGAEQVIREIATRVQARDADARFRMAIVGSDGAGVLGWQTNPARVSAEANYFGMGSALWHAYADAADADGNVVVFLTDGVAADANGTLQPEPPTELIAELRSAPPAIMLGTGELGPAFEGIASITRGIALDIDDTDAAVSAVFEHIQRLRHAYVALSIAPDDSATGEREIKLSLPATGVTAISAYTVPPMSEREAGRGLGGIYLRIQANGVSCTRTLAGVPFQSGHPWSSERAEEMQAALFGSYSVITDVGAPTPSQVLDDLVAEALSWEPVFAATDADAAFDALVEAEELPHGQFALSVPISGGDALTWDTGLRMWLSIERIIPNGDTAIRRASVDLLPTTRFATAAQTPQESLETTVRRSAQLAAYEAAIYHAAAADRLAGDLVDASQADLDAPQAQAFRRLSAGWPGTTRFAVDETGQAAAAVDRDTGTLIAVSADGTGGGVTEAEIEKSFKQVIALVEMSGSVGALSAWAKLEKAKLEKLRVATLMIHRMSVDGIVDLLQDEACKKLDNAIQAGAMAGLRHADPFAAAAAQTAHETVKEFKRWADAAGMPPAVPTNLKPC